MCLYPRLILNKKYYPTRKNNYNPPPLTDKRLLYVAVGCGNCIECRKQKTNEWRIRLLEEIKTHKSSQFVTLTFSNESLNLLCDTFGLKECNALATKAVRLFLERWRKIHKKSLKHWFITELGQEETERIHLHGIIFNDRPITKEKLEEFWKYGIVDIGDYCNSRTINYITKYCHKIDNKHKNYKPQILCSKGIGANYIEKDNNKYIHKYRGENTREYYTDVHGYKISLPIYYRNKLFSEEERELLWINRIEQNKRYVLGNEIKNIDTHEGEQILFDVLRHAQEYNTLIGYGNDTNEWKEKDYNVTLRMINKKSSMR